MTTVLGYWNVVTMIRILLCLKVLRLLASSLVVGLYGSVWFLMHLVVVVGVALCCRLTCIWCIWGGKK